MVDETSPESVRRAHLWYEAEIKGVGLLYGLFGGLMLIPLFQAIGEGMMRRGPSAWFFALLISVGALILGAGLRRLSPWVRVPMAVISGLLGVISFFTIVGPLLNGYVLWLMLSAKGRTVMSPQYQLLVNLTPHVKQRTSSTTIVLTLLLVVILGAWVVRLVLSYSSFRQ